ncbi:hypothetical protein LTR08_000775 [Meristemomyces frigidus]|nr:hypothetical protein LTR08_000775 [Meristemomyces frigidus]
MEDVPQASLLGLPRELRFHIYDALLHSDLNYTVLQGFDDVWSREEVRALRSDQRLCLPWANLTLTCRTIAAELRSHTTRPSITADSDTRGQRTYVLELDMSAERRHLGAVTWHSLPCAPSEVDTLVVNCTFGELQASIAFWGAGGPRGIVRALYQTLNAFLRCGPRLDMARPLRRAVHLRELVIRADPAGWSYKKAARLLRMLAGNGLPSGCVDVLRAPDWPAGEWRRRCRRVDGASAPECPAGEWRKGVRRVDGASVPDAWARYEFQSGVDAAESR